MTGVHYYDTQGKLIDPKTPGGMYSVTTILCVRDKPGLDANNLRLGEAAAIERQISASDRGTRVHKAIELFLAGGTLQFAAPDDTVPYILGFRKWLSAAKPQVLATEKFVFSKKHNYAGSVDLLCILDDGPWIIDYKTSNRMDDGMGLQLAAYREAYKEMTGEDFKTAILQLAPKDKDGKYLKRGYRFKEFNEPFDVFLAHKKIFDWNPRAFGGEK